MRESRMKKEFSSLPLGSIILLETSAEKSLEATLGAIKHMTEQDYSGIVLSASRPYSNMSEHCKKNKINEKNLKFLDSVSKAAGQTGKDTDSVCYLEHPSALTSISLSLAESLRKMKGNKFVLMDSVNSMLIHNKPEIFVQFAHHLMTEMRMKNASGILLSLHNETDKKVRSELAELCDKVVQI